MGPTQATTYDPRWLLPTDTAYGLAAAASGPEAVKHLLDAKGRGRNMPSPVLVGSPYALNVLVADLSEQARQLVDAFWPGALTLAARQAPSPQDWDAARGMLADAVAVHLDAGPTPAAVASSIVDVTSDLPVLLRAGAPSTERLREVAPGLRER